MATGDKALVVAMARERVRLVCAQLEVTRNGLDRALVEMRSLLAVLQYQRPEPPPE